MIKKLKEYNSFSNKKRNSKIKPKIGIALGAGGARGIAHLKFLEVFDELGIKTYMISGCSMGSLLGALYCSGISAKDLIKYFENLTIKEIQKLTDVTIDKSGFIKGDKATKEFLKAVKCKKLESLKIPLKVIATDFYNGKEIVFQKGSIEKAIRASCAIPGVFIPEKTKTKILIDGGIVNPVPYDLLMKSCDYVIAIDVTEGTASKKRLEDKKQNIIPSVYDIVYNSYEIIQTNIVNNMVKVDPPNLYIKPNVNMFNMMEFHKGKEILKAVKNDVYKFKKILKELFFNN